MRKGKAYAARMAYTDEVQVSEAWHEFNTAKDYRGAVEAMNTLQLFPQNVMVAAKGPGQTYPVPQRSRQGALIPRALDSFLNQEGRAFHVLPARFR
jgi:hypothetical protein